jgi:hypothetical protein
MNTQQCYVAFLVEVEERTIECSTVFFVDQFTLLYQVKKCSLQIVASCTCVSCNSGKCGITLDSIGYNAGWFLS